MSFMFILVFGPVVLGVFTEVIMKNSVFWNITPCSALKVKRSFGGTCYLHLHGQRINQARSQHACYLLHTSFLFGLFFNPEDGSNMFLQKIS
jgi:hypothetical protein